MSDNAALTPKWKFNQLGPYLIVGAGAFGLGFTCCYISGANCKTQTIDQRVGIVQSDSSAEAGRRSERTSVPGLTWSGTGAKSTETFEVSSSEWVVEWQATPGNHSGNFILTVHRTESPMQLYDTAVNEIVNETKKGRTTIRGNGRFFLKAIATCQWSASVIE